MSYILEALRRADRDRQQQELRAPSLSIDGMPTPSLPTRRARVALPAVAIAAVVVIASWWVSQRAADVPQESRISTSTEPSAPARPEVTATPSLTVASAAEGPGEQAPVSPAVAEPAAGTTAPASAAPAPAPSPTAEMPSPPPVAARPRTSLVVDAVAVPAARAETPPPPAPGPAAVAAREPAARPVEPVSPVGEIPPAWRDLPAEERRALPHPDLDVHVYDAAAERRFVMIALRRYREGEALPDGLLIDEITPDGIVVEHRGRRYTLPRR